MVTMRQSSGDGRGGHRKEPSADPDAMPHVAVVGGRPIPISRVEARMAEMRRGPRGRHVPPEGGFGSVGLRRWIVQELVTEDVLIQEARAAGLIASASYAHDAPVPALSRAAVARLVENVTSSVTVTGNATRDYYERNRDLYRRREARRVRHILLSDEASSRVVADRLSGGAEMGALADSESVDAGSRAQGGDLGDIHRGELSGTLEDAIFESGIGVIIGPIQTEHGWHIARVEGVTPASQVPYGEVRPAIEAELLAAERTRMFGAWLEGRRRALAVIEPGFEHPAHPAHGLPSHRH